MGGGEKLNWNLKKTCSSGLHETKLESQQGNLGHLKYNPKMRNLRLDTKTTNPILLGILKIVHDVKCFFYQYVSKWP